jgi:hypothetical protein
MHLTERWLNLEERWDGTVVCAGLSGVAWVHKIHEYPILNRNKISLLTCFRVRNLLLKLTNKKYGTLLRVKIRGRHSAYVLILMIKLLLSD